MSTPTSTALAGTAFRGEEGWSMSLLLSFRSTDATSNVEVAAHEAVVLPCAH
jgi:hypothetical protein